MLLIQTFGTLPPADEPWLLLASVALGALAFFLLHQAAAFQRWATAKDEAAPNPDAGVGMAWGISLAIVCFWALYWWSRQPAVRGGADTFILGVLTRPSDFVPAALLAGMVPAAVSAFKFVIITFIMQRAPKKASSLSRSPLAAIAGAVFALLQLAASIATLLAFFSRNPATP